LFVIIFFGCEHIISKTGINQSKVMYVIGVLFYLKFFELKSRACLVVFWS